MKKFLLISYFEGLLFGLIILFGPSILTGAFGSPGELKLLLLYELFNGVIFSLIINQLKKNLGGSKSWGMLILCNGLGFISALIMLIASFYVAVQNWQVVL